MVKKCPYCFEDLEKDITTKCNHCSQFLVDGVIDTEYHGVEKKRCIFCDKMILKEARVCKYCHKWIDEVMDAAEDIEEIDGFEEIE